MAENTKSGKKMLSNRSFRPSTRRERGPSRLHAELSEYRMREMSSKDPWMQQKHKGQTVKQVIKGMKRRLSKYLRSRSMTRTKRTTLEQDATASFAHNKRSEPHERRHLLTHTVEGKLVETKSSSATMETKPERGQTVTELPINTVSNLVQVSLTRKLSGFVEVELEMMHGFPSIRGKTSPDAFEHGDFTSGEDDYQFFMRDKGLKIGLNKSSPLKGNHSLPQVSESSGKPSIQLPGNLVLNEGGSRLTSPPKYRKWRETSVMVLRDNSLSSLPKKPYCPNLVLLFLQRNKSLRIIPDSFFSTMQSLRVVDLSDNQMSHLPASLFKLQKLQVLILCNCRLLDELPKEVKGLIQLEVLDLTRTELYKAPDEIGHLTYLRNLQLTFYGTDDESEYLHLPQDVLSQNILSRLQQLEALSIVVHPEDVRWIRNAESMMQDVATLKKLCYLEFYFPRMELLGQFSETSPSWENISMNKFKFVVGQNVKRFVDRVPNDVEVKFNQQKRSLRFVNGEDIPPAIKEVLKCVTAFYLDHHLAIRSLSELGITISKEIAFCVVRECPNIEVIIMDNEDTEPAYPSLEHMEMHYLWKLEAISRRLLPEGSFSSLKYLALHTCPRVEFIFYGSTLKFFHKLEELVVEDCETLKEIIRESDRDANDSTCALPHTLRKIKLHYLPQLLTFWWKLEDNLKDPISKGDSDDILYATLEAESGDLVPGENPEDNILSVTVYSCPRLQSDSLKAIAKNVKFQELNSEDVFQNEDPVSVH